ncbi:MAG: Ig-like domain repeat protein, partial [Prosthecobacter sp.]
MAGVGNSGNNTSWTTITSSPLGGTFSGSLGPVVAGGWYQIEVRSITAGIPGPVFIVQRVGVGDIYLTAGQSNSANFGAPYGTIFDDRISAYNYTNSNWSKAADPMPGGGGAGGSVWSRLGDLLISRDNVPVAFACMGEGSSQVVNWVPGSGTYYSTHITTTVQAFPLNGFRAFLWHQGENDSLESTSTTLYQTRLNSIISQSRVDAGWSIPWYVAEASNFPFASLIQEERVVAGQRRVIFADALVFPGPVTDDFHLEDKLTEDLVHCNSAGFADHAAQWAAVLGGAPDLAPKNGNFESNLSIADGASASINTSSFSSPSVVGWRVLNASEEAVADGDCGYYNPSNASYIGSSDGGTSGGVLPAMAGRHVAYLSNSSAGSGFLQTRRANLEPAVSYTLTVAIGVRGNDNIFGNASIEILANGIPIASRNVSRADLDLLNGGNAANTFTDVSVNITTPEVVSPGQALAVRIRKTNGSGTYLDFDNVRLDVSTTINLATLTPSIYGELVTFTANVEPKPAAGTVQFYDNGVTIGSPVPIINGQGRYTTSALSAGSHAITAVYIGALGFSGSTTASSTIQMISPAIPVVTITGPTVFTYNGSAQGPNSIDTGGSTGAVTYSYQGVSGTNYTVSSTPPINAGNYTVTATVTADPNYLTGSSSVTAFSISKATPLIMWAKPNFITVGSSLSGTQLNATSSGVPGDFVYTPPNGTVLNSLGNHTLSVQFTPSDLANYFIPNAKTTTIEVKPVISITTLNVADWSTQQYLLEGDVLTPTMIHGPGNVLGTATQIGTGLDAERLEVLFNGSRQWLDMWFSSNNGGTVEFLFVPTGTPNNGYDIGSIVSWSGGFAYQTGQKYSVAYKTISNTTWQTLPGQIGATVNQPYPLGLGHQAVTISDTGLTGVTALKFTFYNNENAEKTSYLELGIYGSPSVSTAVPSTVTVTGTTVFTYNAAPQGPNTASVTGSTGAVSYSYEGVSGTSYPACSTQPSNAGSYTVTASVAADENYLAASSSATAFTIGKATPTAALAVSNSPQTYTSSAKAAVVTISASSVPGTVTNILTGGAATQTAVGTYAVTADFVPTDTLNYQTLTSLPVDNFTIDKASSTVTPIIGSYTYTGLGQGPNTASVTSSTGAVSYSYEGVSGTSYPASSTQPSNAGSYTVTASVAADENYLAASSSATAFTIGKATPTAALAVSNSPQTYTGSAKAAVVTISASSVPGTVTNILTGGAATQTAV